MTVELDQSTDFEQEKNFYEAIIERTQDGILVFNDKLEVIFANESVINLVGGERSTIIGMDLSEFIPMDKRGSHEKLVSLFAISMDKTQQLNNWRSIKCRRLDGTEFPAKIIVHKFIKGDEMVYIVSIRDMSEFEAADAKAQSAEFNGFMQQQLQVCTADVLKFNLEKTIGRIAKSATDIKKSIAGQEVVNAMNEILGNSFAAMTICQSALFFSPLALKQGQVRLVNQTLKGTFDRMQLLFNEKAQFKKIFMDWKIPKDAGEYRLSDCHSIEQILYNIIDDSIETAERGSITVSVSKCSEDENGENLLLEFSIFNPSFGVPQHLMDEIFASDRTEDVSDDVNLKSAGMCLRLAKSLTENLGGKMLISSHPLNGTSIKAELTQPLIKVTKKKADTPPTD